MKFEELIGKTLSEIVVSKDKEIITFIEDNGKKYEMYHDQNCCESVLVEDICGELDDLIGVPIIRASEDTNSETNPDDYKVASYGQESFTWTFYNIATAKGHVTIRWYGESNGYYSESVNFREVKIYESN